MDAYHSQSNNFHIEMFDWVNFDMNKKTVDMYG